MMASAKAANPFRESRLIGELPSRAFEARRLIEVDPYRLSIALHSLAVALVGAKTNGMLNGTLEHFPWAVASPMSLPQEFVDAFDVETLKAALYLNSIS
jgi:hypothetical protein